MLRAASLLRRGVAGLAALMAWAAGWNYVACALFITADIVGRNALGVSSAATVEITGYMLACGIAWGLAHALACRAHIRVDVLLMRLPTRLRAPLHVFSLLLLTGFALFIAWAAWELVDESALFDAHDNSALRVPLVIPQGIWAVGLSAFVLMCGVLLLESLLALLLGEGARLDNLLGSRTLADETEEALEAVAMARK
ncbi:TRAP transporter small permease [Roseococcus sp. SDR]|uniref:TRAP transporter small permease subunit n=1 Tax=Roseococcus sp. SDR TaxID=2835532 RepID=UPI001BCB5305|nr:TRAP transporter small permease [Roseococcus sp. SDR]MBS7790945.1 TRAP transporter small permease [Roseococcus sp. SDR]MBV1846259.1 TRAP transporter small permease [Roseococcus sp. SDR]